MVSGSNAMIYSKWSEGELEKILDIRSEKWQIHFGVSFVFVLGVFFNQEQHVQLMSSKSINLPGILIPTLGCVSIWDEKWRKWSQSILFDRIRTYTPAEGW